ncbi:ABC transporter permease [candidate division KSB1 bacterium]|nr:ABC transporter permease [candidate division KSB1 bacterium]
MAHFLNTLSEIFSYLRQYKARTFMTLFGLIWGTISLVVLLAFGFGLKDAMSKNMHGMGEGIVILFGGRTGLPFEGYNRGRAIRFREEDADLLRREIPNIASITPEYRRWSVPIRLRDKVYNANIGGVDIEYQEMRHLWPQEGGRWLNELDLAQRRRIAFIGDKLEDFLFGQEESAIGKTIYVQDSPFLVVGVLRKKVQNSSYGMRDEESIFIPSTTFQSIYGHRYLNNIVYKMHDPNLTESTKTQLYQVLGKKYKFDPSDKQAFHIWDTSEMDKFIFYFSLGFNLFMALIGAMTLIVGGIGLANIMYVVVQERTREIGIRRAVGAPKRAILWQFISESLIIIALGAIIGFFLSLLLVKAIGLLPYEEYVGDPTLSWPIAIIAVALLGLIGILAGFFPARKAANMVIIDSIRH